MSGQEFAPPKLKTDQLLKQPSAAPVELLESLKQTNVAMEGRIAQNKVAIEQTLPEYVKILPEAGNNRANYLKEEIPKFQAYTQELENQKLTLKPSVDALASGEDIKKVEARFYKDNGISIQEFQAGIREKIKEVEAGDQQDKAQIAAYKKVFNVGGVEINVADKLSNVGTEALGVFAGSFAGLRSFRAREQAAVGHQPVDTTKLPVNPPVPSQIGANLSSETVVPKTLSTRVKDLVQSVFRREEPTAVPLKTPPAQDNKYGGLYTQDQLDRKIVPEVFSGKQAPVVKEPLSRIDQLIKESQEQLKAEAARKATKPAAPVPPVQHITSAELAGALAEMEKKSGFKIGPFKIW